MLDCINSDVRSRSGVNQWRNTATVLEWFSNLQEKSKLSFIVFDIVDFYPSISEELIKKWLDWARQYTVISDIQIDTIMHARQTLLYDNKSDIWTKRNTTNQFDVSMGAFDGAEICELVGLFILKQA